MTREDIWDKITLDEINSVAHLCNLSSEDVKRVLQGVELANYNRIIRICEDFVTARIAVTDKAHQEVYSDWMKWLAKVLA